MIANLFSKSKPINVFSISLLLFAFYFISTFLSNPIEYSFGYITNWLGFFIWPLLILFIIKFIIEKNKLTRDNSFALLVSVLLLGMFPTTMSSNAIIFSNLTLLLAFRKIYSLKSGLNIKVKIFDAAFWIGISTLIYSWSILFVLLIYAGILLFKKNNIKNLIIPVIGVVTPIFIYFTYNFYFDSLDIFYQRLLFEVNFDFNYYNSLRFLIPILFLGITLLWSVVTITPKIITMGTNFKLSWSVLIYHLLISIIIVVTSPIKSGAELFYLVFPSSVIIANLLQNSKSSIFKNVMLYLFLMLAVVINFL